MSRIGMMMDYEMTIIDYCDRLVQDTSFPHEFRRLAVSHKLVTFQRELLDLAFLDENTTSTNTTHGDVEDQEEDVANHHHHHCHQLARQRALQNCRRIAKYGLTEVHFDRMKSHFAESLRHTWVNDQDIQIVLKHLESIRHLFAGEMVQVLRRKSNPNSSPALPSEAPKHKELPVEHSAPAPREHHLRAGLNRLFGNRRQM